MKVGGTRGFSEPSRAALLAVVVALSLVAGALPGTAVAAPGDVGATMVADINPAGSSNAKSLVRLGNLIVFVADDGSTGEELWRSDGTAAGTTMLKDINPGMDDDPPDPDTSDPAKLKVVGSTVYFVANDGVNGRELWKTDGTTAGTTLVKDVNPGMDDDPPAPDDSQIDWLTDVNGTLFFAATDGSNGLELWKSDGTEPNTVIMNGPGGIGPAGADSSPNWLAALGTTLFFSANGGTNGEELWKSEAPYTSAVEVANINPGAPSSSPAFLVDYNGTLFFRAIQASTGIELWKSNGGPLVVGGTEMVKDINQNPDISANSSPQALTVAGGTLFFQATDGMTGPELWKSTGTTAGTIPVADIRPGGNGSTPYSLTNLGGTLFFTATDGSTGLEPWKSDGGPLGAGTSRVADINPGLPDSSPATFFGTSYIDVGGTAFFDADDGSTGRELWMSSGAGTRRVADINPGIAASGPGHFLNLNGTLYFAASTASSGAELWKTFIEGPATPVGSTTAEDPECQPLRGKIQKLSRRIRKAEDPDVKAKLKKKRRNARKRLAELGCP